MVNQIHRLMTDLQPRVLSKTNYRSESRRQSAAAVVFVIVHQMFNGLLLFE